MTELGVRSWSLDSHFIRIIKRKPIIKNEIREKDREKVIERKIT